jgi:hypothetical protein
VTFTCVLAFCERKSHNRYAYMHLHTLQCSGSMDTTVRVDHIESANDHASSVFRCHTDRVKAIETDFSNPQLFWSASEDGR